MKLVRLTDGKGGTHRVPPVASGKSAAGVVAVVATAAVALANAAPGGAAAAPEQDQDHDEPQAGAVIVSIVKAHDCHLAL